MKFLTATMLLSLACADLFDPWKALPPKDDWRAILKSFDKPDDIKPYVEIYVKPFQQLQKATRDNKISPESMKTSMHALLDLVQQCCKNFNITTDIFKGRKKEDFRKILDGATQVFEGPNADHLEPVFKKISIHRFMHQRLDDMLVAAKTKDEVLNRVKKLSDLAKNLQKKSKEWKPIKFKYIIQRNLDLQVVAQYSTSVLKNRKDKGLKKGGLDQMYWKLHSLGNSASSTYQFSAVSIAFAVVLAVMI
ncbi:hypothetical protein PSACC_02370 [Paramicrosporidium saccamoebae]|uniref:Uncharacterized protein n=1 Tax=Paramicrosporidium saccamoebae TaxID=1246581 RepID=A0A2H9TJ66_9FUNG|nr:hypothetical protein PSACC_02370 [Paramicrosporidium saccamoebae]